MRWSLGANSELLFRFWKVVENQADAVVASDSFLDLGQDLLLQLVRRDICVKESVLYARVIAWAKHQCTKNDHKPTAENVRAALGEVLYAIRFPLMSMEEFFDKPVHDDYLTAEVCLDDNPG